MNQQGILSFVRTHKTGDLLVIQNLTNQPQKVLLTKETQKFKKLLFHSASTKASLQGNEILLPAAALVILQ